MTPEQWVTVAVAFVAGQGFAKLIEMIGSLWAGTASRRRSEVDRISAVATEAQAQVKVYEAQAKIAARRERIAVEHAHEVRVIALQAGVPSAKLPVLDFKDDE